MAMPVYGALRRVVGERKLTRALRRRRGAIIQCILSSGGAGRCLEHGGTPIHSLPTHRCRVPEFCDARLLLAETSEQDRVVGTGLISEVGVCNSDGLQRFLVVVPETADQVGVP